MKDELGGKIMTNFVGLRVKPYSYLIDDRSDGKKAKGSWEENSKLEISKTV